MYRVSVSSCFYEGFSGVAESLLIKAIRSEKLRKMYKKWLSFFMECYICCCTLKVFFYLVMIVATFGFLLVMVLDNPSVSVW